MDTETTGLSLDDDIWEFAAIRREEDGTETEHHLFIEHSVKKCHGLPESFFRDHISRWDTRVALGPEAAVGVIANLFDGKPHVVGAVPNFDTERIALLLSRYGIKPNWHYHLIDVENLAVGYLWGQQKAYPVIGRELRTPLPWNSDDLSRSCGVIPPTDERHTAMGDARWAKALYDAIVGAS
jgi:hypothetical protein